MRSFLLLFLAIAHSVIAVAQYKVVIKINSLPSSPVSESVYIAGSFNNWNPKDEAFKLRKEADDKFTITFPDVPAGDYEYKFTRGGWETVETTADGRQIGNRTLKLMSDTTLNIDINGWSEGKPRQIPHTANSRVQILDTAFYIPQLHRRRRIWIYMPKDYATSKTRYPVLYMHDGQNLFDDATSFAGEWGIDEAIDSAKKQCIVVGIDNGGVKRMNEYNPYNHERYGKGEGDLYVQFIAKTLKPLIDKKYRTRKEAANTIICGSSMGGLISMYAVMKYPKTFGKAGVFSPAFWVAPQLKADIEKNVKPSTHKNLRIYFYGGDQEGGEMVKGMLYIFELMRKKSNPKMKAKINAEGKHNEPTWRNEFPAFYNWIL
ncbi:MAG TPA: alpha/beta hydrolase-fold protein [Chitinophagaceae bacterium]|nr:alpha/beta hydrolase-fold protein [Chitinophagaceae bacterium]